MCRITTFKGFHDYTWILEKEMEWKMCGRPVKSTGIYKTLLWCNLVQDFFFFFFFPFQVALFIYFLLLYLLLFLVYCGCVGMTRADALKNEV